MGVHIDSINKQYSTKYNYLIPTNLYGEHDKDDEQKSHFITALIKKIMDAKRDNKDSITLFGDGTPLRQFMHANDLAKVIFDVINKGIYENFNVATSENLTIKKMAEIALDVCEAKHLSIIWDTSKPNGQYRKDVCTNKLNILLPDFKALSLSEGIKTIYNDKISK
jgi:GDP-L-fucose synthase